MAYLGWTNWETWNVALHAANDQDVYHAVRSYLEDADTFPSVEEFALECGTLFCMLASGDFESLDGDFQLIDWEEILESWREDWEELHENDNDYVIYQIPEWAMSAIVNDDWSIFTLYETIAEDGTAVPCRDEIVLENFLESIKDEGYLVLKDTAPYYANHNDVNGLPGNVYDMSLIPHTK